MDSEAVPRPDAMIDGECGAPQNDQMTGVIGLGVEMILLRGDAWRWWFSSRGRGMVIAPHIEVCPMFSGQY